MISLIHEIEGICTRKLSKQMKYEMARKNEHMMELFPTEFVSSLMKQKGQEEKYRTLFSFDSGKLN